MRPTRRGWAAGLLALSCLVLAALLESRGFLLAGAGVLAVLVVAAVGFLRTVIRVAEDAAVTQRLAPARTRVDEPVTYRVDVSLPSVARGPVSVSTNPPVGFTTDDDGTTTLDADIDAAHVVATGTLPAAGTFSFAPPTLAVTDRAGFFRHAVDVGDQRSLTVEPRGPRDVHVGAGGNRIGIAYGEHTAAQGSAGIEPSEIRRYLPGDPTNRIDWKATARLNEPHIREFEAETDQPTVLVVDTRASMRDGPAAETKLDYARDLALWFTDYADAYSDPLGLWTVTDGGLATQFSPASTEDAYRRIRTNLRALTADGPTARRQSPGGRHGGREAHAAAAATGDRDTRFDRTLGAYFSETTPYVARVEDEPLFRVVTTALARVAGRPLVVLVTDDENRVEVRETVKSIRRRGRAVVVFLLPSVLFADRAVTDVDAAYDRYRSFESFRQDLAALDSVSAFEVGPADRLNAVLAAARTDQHAAP